MSHDDERVVRYLHKHCIRYYAIITLYSIIVQERLTPCFFLQFITLLLLHRYCALLSILHLHSPVKLFRSYPLVFLAC